MNIFVRTNILTSVLYPIDCFNFLNMNNDEMIDGNTMIGQNANPGTNDLSILLKGSMHFESKLTPWEVKGKINYMDQIKKFGTKPMDGGLIERWERVTKTKVHHYIRRGLVFSHQDVDKILDCVEQGTPVYLYTGRGPSSSVMHLGHLVPFRLTKYLQDALNCIVVIQLSDDEKYLFKDGEGPVDLDRYRQYSYSNARDIIACGFDVNKTFLFSNLEYNSGDLYFNNILMMKSMNMTTIKSTYGLGETLPQSILDILTREHQIEESKPESDRDLKKIDELRGTLKKFSGDQASNLGQVAWTAFQASPAFRNIFSKAIAQALLNKSDSMPSYVKERMNNVYTELTTLGSTQSMMCLVGMAIDQSPFFRTARDNAATLLCPKPAAIHSEFLPGLKQTAKMGTTSEDAKNSTIFLDMNPKQVEKIIKQHSFSGGCDTMEEHKLYGGDIKIDIAYQYLTFFLESDDELRNIAEQYTKGTMGTGSLKKLTADIVAKEIDIHQKNKDLITDEMVKHFFNPDRDFDIGGVYDRKIFDTTQDQYNDYANYGVHYDRTFGMKCLIKPTKSN
jgi:tryptophanyl-tRNA synthetase